MSPLPSTYVEGRGRHCCPAVAAVIADTSAATASSKIEFNVDNSNKITINASGSLLVATQSTTNIAANADDIILSSLNEIQENEDVHDVCKENRCVQLFLYLGDLWILCVLLV